METEELPGVGKAILKPLIMCRYLKSCSSTARDCPIFPLDGEVLTISRLGTAWEASQRAPGPQDWDITAG